MEQIEVLKLSPYTFPERISSSHLTEDLNKAFKEAGFHTTVITPTPCRGIDEETRKKYKHIKHESLEDGSIDVYRFPLFKEGKNPIGRAVRYIICNLIQYRKGIKAENVDVVYAGSTPPTQGLLCGKVAKTLSKKYGHRVPFVYNLQDVFPDSLVSTGLTRKGSIIWKLGRVIENKTYKYADKIIVISNDMKMNIINKGVPKEKIEVIPNWINTQKVSHIPRENNKLFDELGIDRTKFILVYAGNLGLAQGIDGIVEAFKELVDVEFVIFGKGSNQDEIARKSKGFNNVHVFPLMPQDRVSEVYSMGDLCLVSCRQGMGSGGVPSKTFSIMATATPILLSFDSETELWNLIESEGCGLCSHSGNNNELVSTIEYAKSHQDELEIMSEKARVCVERRFSTEMGTSSYIRIIEELCCDNHNIM